MWLPNWAAKSRSLASLGMTMGVAVALIAGLVLLWHRPDEPAVSTIRQMATQITLAENSRTIAAAAVERARASANMAERVAAVAVSRAVAARARVRVVSAEGLVVTVTPNAEPEVVRVPTPVVERIRLDSAAVDALGLLVQRKDTVIVAQDRRITADSVELAGRAKAFAALGRVKEPRCGRRCGIVLGVGGMLATAIAVEQVRRAIR